jgi:hypothetical protein
MNRFLRSLLICFSGLSRGLLQAKVDIVTEKIAAKKSQPLRKKTPPSTPAWEYRKTSTRASYIDPLGLASPFTPGTELDLYREPGRRLSSGKGIITSRLNPDKP